MEWDVSMRNYITGGGAFPTHIHAISYTRERRQQQTWKGTAEAKAILESVVSGPSLATIHPSGILLLVGWHREVDCHPLLPWLGHWHLVDFNTLLTAGVPCCPTCWMCLQVCGCASRTEEAGPRKWSHTRDHPPTFCLTTDWKRMLSANV